MKNGTFYGVGLGPGDPELVTLKALKVLQHADRIYTVAVGSSEHSVSESIVQALPGISAKIETLLFTMSKDWDERLKRIGEHAETIAAALQNGLDCAFVTIGDPMTYSTCSYLMHAIRERIPELNAEIVPGVNSWSVLFSKTQNPLVEDRETLRIVPSLDPENPDFPENSTTILLKTYHTRNRLLNRIPADAFVWYGANLGLENETITSGKEEIASLPETYLSMLAVKRRKQS